MDPRKMMRVAHFRMTSHPEVNVGEGVLVRERLTYTDATHIEKPMETDSDPGCKGDTDLGWNEEDV